MKIYASKNYEELSYMVASQETLYNILEDEKIYSSNPESSSKKRFVSLSRNLSSAAERNPKRWRYGVILDGSRLTDKYIVKPYSYFGNEYKSKKKSLRVKKITSYDNGQYTLTLVNFPTIDISKEIYDEIIYLIKEDKQKINNKKKLIYKAGKQRRQGKMILEQFLYNVPSGGLVLSSDILSSKAQALLAHHTSFNETEERLYTDTKLVDIHNCIVGILVPKGEEVYEEIEAICKEHHYRISTY